jgi:hypothetical protein
VKETILRETFKVCTLDPEEWFLVFAVSLKFPLDVRHDANQ